MYIFLILAVAFAVIQAYSTYAELPKVEYITKPAVMICLFLWLYLATGLRSIALWFGLGVLFSMAGDVLLLWLDRMFLNGLVAFLCAHVFYIIGFKNEFEVVSIWSVILATILVISAVRLMRPIVSSIRASGQARLIIPVIIYSIVISVMLYAALATTYDLTWKPGASLLVAAGAFFFYLSDLILAWNKFVTPMTRGPLLNLGLYHAGQIMIVAGVIGQFD